MNHRLPFVPHKRLSDPGGLIRLDRPNVHVLVEDARTGARLAEHHSRNKVVSAGVAVVRDLILNVGPAPGYIALGTGTTVAASKDTQLETEVYRAAVTRKLANALTPTFKLFVPSTDANGFTIAEVGLFVNATYADNVPLGGGTLFARGLITPIAKDSSVQITISWEFPITVA